MTPPSLPVFASAASERSNVATKVMKSPMTCDARFIHLQGFRRHIAVTSAAMHKRSLSSPERLCGLRHDRCLWPLCHRLSAKYKRPPHLPLLWLVEINHNIAGRLKKRALPK